MPILFVQFARYGPYHHARLQSAVAELCPGGWDVMGLETAGRDVTYTWETVEVAVDGPKVVTLFPDRLAEDLSSRECQQAYEAALNDWQPDAIAIAGWGTPDARSCLDWCRKNGAKAIVMSETREADGTRVWWEEWIKGCIIRRFDGALVGGKSHRDYLVKLGMPAEQIRFGYNVVDNAYFSAEGAKWQKLRLEIEDVEAVSSSLNQNSKFEIQNPPFFLASNRFIERKNLKRLIEAYAHYLHSKSPAWDLCLLGDGDEKPALLTLCKEYGLGVIESSPWEGSDSSKIQNPKSNIVYFPGFQQIEKLPRFYAHAGCFIHPAIEEPWGLVVNEAMACGLPILSGSNVGAAEELVDDGVNGWVFEATQVEAMSTMLERIAGMGNAERQKMGKESEMILRERAATESFGKGLAELMELIR